MLIRLIKQKVKLAVSWHCYAVNHQVLYSNYRAVVSNAS